jgi:feruloyl esterase
MGGSRLKVGLLSTTLGVGMLGGNLVAAAPASAAPANCTLAALNALHIHNITIKSATDVPASGSNPEYCDVLGAVATGGEGFGPGSSDFEAKLPAVWKNRYVFLGVGGFSGVLNPSVNAVDSASFLPKGYATVVTDQGHVSNPALSAATFALTAPGVPDIPAIVDYSYRATHQVGVATKEMVQGYYSNRIHWAYYDGCSGGGRESMEELERYPDDYDGNIVGDPGMDTRGQLIRVRAQKGQLIPPSAYIPATMLAIIDNAVYASCDAADGVTDGLIQNPAKCSFDPKVLLCKAGQDPSACLTQDQVNNITGYLGPVIDARGFLVSPGQTPTDLSESGGMASWTTGLTPPINFTGPEPWGGVGNAPAPSGWGLTDGYLKFFVYRDPNFNLLTYNLNAKTGVVDSDALKLFDERTVIVNTDDPKNLLPALARHKKVIMYHGFSDSAISPYRTEIFYNELAELFGGDYDKVQSDVRLFMVPGMHHCSGGPGPNSFDTLTALENWVEKGAAPDGIVATNTTSGRSMPLCKYPDQAKYVGGDVNVATSWRCEPNRALLSIGQTGRNAGLSLRRNNADEHLENLSEEHRNDSSEGSHGDQ